MAGENRVFVHSRIAEEPVRRFDIGPILAGEEDRLAQLSRQLPAKATEPLPEPLIREGRTAYFLLQPSRIGSAAVAGLRRSLQQGLR